MQYAFVFSTTLLFKKKRNSKIASQHICAHVSIDIQSSSSNSLNLHQFLFYLKPIK